MKRKAGKDKQAKQKDTRKDQNSKNESADSQVNLNLICAIV